MCVLIREWTLHGSVRTLIPVPTYKRFPCPDGFCRTLLLQTNRSLGFLFSSGHRSGQAWKFLGWIKLCSEESKAEVHWHKGWGKWPTAHPRFYMLFWKSWTKAWKLLFVLPMQSDSKFIPKVSSVFSLLGIVGQCPKSRDFVVLLLLNLRESLERSFPSCSRSRRRSQGTGGSFPAGSRGEVTPLNQELWHFSGASYQNRRCLPFPACSGC